LGIGVLITAMNSANALLSSHVGMLPAGIFIHLAGLATVSLVLLVRRERRREGGERPSPYLYGGGAIGVATVLACAYSFTRIGAGLAVALALAGQTAGSLAVDATGFLGMKKYPFSPLRLLWLGLAVAGLFIMVGRSEWRVDPPSFAAAFASGLFTLASSILNSRLSAKIGHWRGVRANFVVGLAVTSLLVLAIRPSLSPLGEGIVQAGPLLLLGGGALGVAVVGGICFMLPRMPVLNATLAMFSGQVAAGLLIDAIAQGPVPTRRIVGAIVLLAGLAGSSIGAPRGASDDLRAKARHD
jgi:transporter family-2 protein